MANLLKDLAAALATGCVDVVPDGWMTSTQHAEASAMGRSRTKEILADGVRKGKVLQRDFRVMTGAGPQSLPHYKVL